jgi:hypothetical protein
MWQFLTNLVGIGASSKDGYKQLGWSSSKAIKM